MRELCIGVSLKFNCVCISRYYVLRNCFHTYILFETIPRKLKCNQNKSGKHRKSRLNKPMLKDFQSELTDLLVTSF